MFSSARSGSRNSRALSGTLAVACLLSVLVASPCPAQPAVGPAVGPVSESRNEKVRGFIDKWVLNGGNIGGAIGAVAGQALGTALFPGPTAMVLGSFVGNQIGQIIGEYTDNKVGEAYNYAAFNRPGLGQDGGGFILPNAGPYEQAFYQLDRWVISGGFLASMGMHFGLNYLGRVVPGGQILLRPLTMIIADYVAGSIGDNIDGSTAARSPGASTGKPRTRPTRTS
ncbi:MAG: hypothetical protein HY815_00120 [Candidatus Riflebacteria bacterium]|nr:hypothetical protein [Candidatus Riflebacteria bacterium]